MAIRPLPDQTRNLATLTKQLETSEVLLVGFRESGRSHGGRVPSKLTEAELTRCIKAAGVRPVTFYGLPRRDIQPHHKQR